MEAEIPTLQPGDVLAGKYRVEQVLGIGGMGVVAAAWHLELERRVAIKVLRPSGPDDEAQQRFSREARAASRLASDHIVRVFDVGRLDDGRPYLVMEHLVGEDFEDILRARKLGVTEAVGYILQACEGMAEAHAHGIVHRDLKPANLFLTRRVDGRPLVKIVDFGIAKQVNRQSLVSLTGPLMAVGSPQYMSPEQTRGSPDVDARADIWSLGACLYELLTGEPPFNAATVMDICALVLKEIPRAPVEIDPKIPEGLSDIIMRCLQKDPNSRFADAAAFAEALEAFAAPSAQGTSSRARHVLGSPDPAREMAQSWPSRPPSEQPTHEPSGYDVVPVSRRRWSRSSVLAVGVVGVLTTLLAWNWAGGRRQSQTLPEPFPVAAIPGTATDSSPVVLLPRTVTPTSPTSAVQMPSQPQTISMSRGTKSAHGGSKGSTGSSPLAARDLPSDPAGGGQTLVTPAVTPAPPAPAPTPTPTVAPAPVAPRFVLASARVDVGSATNTVGTTAANVNRAIAPLASKMTACYRDALPQVTGAVDGSGMLHLETDEEGAIVGSRVDGAVPASSRCIAALAAGRKIPNVDTGRARADIPLVFHAQ